MAERIDAFFSYGFRPFFLSAGLYAAVGMAAWMAWIGLHAAGGEVRMMSTAFPPFQWHAHEMLYGYTAAAIAGFLLTAVPSWTGRHPITGAPLAVLFGVWVLGRIAVWFSNFLHPLAVAVADVSFLAFLLALVLKSLIGGKRRNFIFVGVLAVLIAGNVLVHLEQLKLTDGTTTVGHLLALDTVILLIATIGGRVGPAFTRNALRRPGEPEPVPAWPWIDRASVASVAAVLVADVVQPGGAAAGALAALAAAANGIRLAGWRGLSVLDQPILWIIHVGYGWLVVGLAAKGLALLTGVTAEVTALHVLTVGAVGSMTLGIMTRAGLGHTGRPLRVAPSIVAAYVLVSFATVVRVGGPLWLPAYYNAAVLTAGIAWCVAFALFAWVYWPILTRPRIRGAD
jgi:uncharacterized protein involved in response to NO